MTPSHPIRRALATAAGAAVAVVGTLTLAVPSIASGSTALGGGNSHDNQLVLGARRRRLTDAA